MAESTGRVPGHGRGDRPTAGTPPQPATRSSAQIRVLLADDHTLFRQGMRALLEAERDMAVVGEARNGREAISEALRLKPDVVAMDIAMPIMNGLEATRYLAKHQGGIKVLVVTTHVYEENILELMEMGACGYLFKDADFSELALAIRKVHQGNSYLSPSLSAGAVQDYLRRARNGDPAKNGLLTSREQEVLQMVAEGYGNKQVAQQLFISRKTVEAHKASIIRKLDIRGNAELVKYAVMRGLVDIER